MSRNSRILAHSEGQLFSAMEAPPPLSGPPSRPRAVSEASRSNLADKFAPSRTSVAVNLPRPFHQGTTFQMTVTFRGILACSMKSRQASAVASSLSRLIKPEPFRSPISAAVGFALTQPGNVCSERRNVRRLSRSPASAISCADRQS